LFSKILNLVNSNELKGKFARGGLVLTSASAFEIGARLLRNVILTRLLVPEYFGLMAMIMSVMAFFEAFTEVGVRHVVIQNKKGGSEEFLNVAWWFSSIRGACLFVAAFFAAPLVCDFYSAPELLLPIRAAFAALLLNGIVSPRIHALEKELKYLKFVAMKQGSAVLNVVTAVVLSLFIKSVWPLVIGLVIEYAGICLLSYVLIPFRPKLRINKTYMGEILRFARGMFGLPILTFTFFQFDIFIIGKLLTREELGLYSIARSLALVSILAFSKIVRPLVLPALSKIKDSKKSLKMALLNITDLICVVCMPFTAFCVVFAEPLLSFAYGPRYGTVSASYSILAVYVLFRLLGIILMQLFYVLAAPHLQRRFALIRALLVLAVAYPVVNTFGLVGAAMTVLAGMLFMHSMQLACAGKLVALRLSEYAGCLIRGAGYSCIVIIPGLAVRSYLPYSDLQTLIIGVLLCLCAWCFAARTDHYQAIVLGDQTLSS